MSAETRDDSEAFEARLTALALGELPDAERAEVERWLREPDRADARLRVDELRTMATALRAAHGDPEPLSRLPQVRRAVLAAAARPEPSRSPWATGMKWLPSFVGLAAALTLVVTAALWCGIDGTVRRAVPLGNTVADGGRRANGTETTRRVFVNEPAPAAPVAAAPVMPLPAAASSPMASAMPRGIVGKSRRMDDEALEPLPEVMNRRGERYAAVTESRMLSPKEQPLSTFSIDVDTASYANVRRFLVAGRRPPRDAVRIEELVNYFRYDYPQPTGDAPFSVTVDAAECPWRAGHRLVRIGLQGRQVDRGARPAGNLVFLIDVSGSMSAPNKLELVKQALAMLVGELTENDRVTIVTYAGNAGLVLPPTTGDQTRAIQAAIDGLTAGGTTHGSAGIVLAYEQAREHFIEGGSNRVILATDGDLNVGVTSNEALVDLVARNAADGIFLTVLGVGQGNLQDDKLEAIADHGNGLYAYLDGLREARKVLVEQLTGSTMAIAKDVKIQVEFNPAQVASYRLLGYENRALAARDFKDDTKDAGDIGAGHSVTALYEVVLAGDASAAGGGAEPLKYQPQPEPEQPVAADSNASRELLTVKLRWKRPEGAASTLLEVPHADRGGAFAAAPADLRFAAAVAAFGMILRESDQKGDATLPLVAKIAGGALGRDEGGYRAEFLDLVRLAESL